MTGHLDGDRPAGDRPGARQAPLGLLLMMASVPIAAWFSAWGLDGVFHCNRPHVNCGLAFAALIPLAWIGGVALLIPAGVVAVRPVPAWVAWMTFLMVTALIWLLDLTAMWAYRPQGTGRFSFI